MADSKKPRLTVGQSEALSALTKLYGGSEYTDLTIVCGPYTFKVHKAVLCTRSAFFKAACRKDAFKEGEESVINLEALDSIGGADNIGRDDPEAVKIMVEYMYNREYKADGTLAYTIETISTRAAVKTNDPDVESDVEEAENDEEEDAENKGQEIDETQARYAAALNTHAKVFAAGAKYSIDGLKTLALENFVHAARSINEPSKFATQWAEAIITVHTTTEDSLVELRHCVAAILLLPGSALMAIPAIQGAISSMEGLTYNLLTRAHASIWNQECASCRSGGTVHCHGCKYQVAVCSACRRVNSGNMKCLVCDSRPMSNLIK